MISNFRPVSILNCFSKFYENVIKNELLKSMDVYLSPFISACRKNYNTQYILLRLLEEWREHLDNDKIVGGVLLDLSIASDCVPHDLLLAELATYGTDDNLILYIHSYILKRKHLSWDPFFSIVSLMIFTTLLRMLKQITLQMTIR